MLERSEASFPDKMGKRISIWRVLVLNVNLCCVFVTNKHSKTLSRNGYVFIKRVIPQGVLSLRNLPVDGGSSKNLLVTRIRFFNKEIASPAQSRGIAMTFLGKA